MYPFGASPYYSMTYGGWGQPETYGWGPRPYSQVPNNPYGSQANWAGYPTQQEKGKSAVPSSSTTISASANDSGFPYPATTRSELKRLRKCHRGEIRPPNPAKHLKTISFDSQTNRFSCYLYSHTAEQVHLSLNKYLNSTPVPFIPHRRRALQDYADLINNPRFSTNPDSLEYITAAFNIFDRLYFFGALRGLVDLKFLQRNESAFMGSKTMVAQTIYMQNIIGNPWPNRNSRLECVITIRDLRARAEIYPGIENVSFRKREYLVVMLHEMIHAMLGLYSCYKCHGCKLAWHRDIGCLGHLGRFQDVAMLIERKTAEELADGGMDMERLAGVVTDIASGGAGPQAVAMVCFIPSDAEMRRWGMDPLNVRMLAQRQFAYTNTPQY